MKLANCHPELLLEAAEERGLNLWQFARLIEQNTEVSAVKIYSWIVFRKAPRLKADVYLVAQYLNWSLEYFAFGVGLDETDILMLAEKHSSYIKKEYDACAAEGIKKRFERQKYINLENEGQMHFGFSESYTNEPIKEEKAG